MAIVIAECCGNHNGSVDLLLEMVERAADTGADYCKMQSQSTTDLTSRPGFEDGKKNPDGSVKRIERPYAQEVERLKVLDLPEGTDEKFIAACEKTGIKALTTVFTRQQIPRLRSLGWDDVKVASPDCASFVMLEELKTAFKRVIISTGMMYDNEIAQAAKIMGDTEFAFLHCVSIYPTPLNKLHLARMEWLRGFTSTVGFSDHSLVDRDGILASVAALAFGANIIERHFTLLPRGETRDGPVSINPEELGELVGFAAMKPSPVLEWCQSNIPSLSEVEGTANREMTDGELLNRDYYRGRFASSVDGRWVFNWEDEPVS